MWQNFIPFRRGRGPPTRKCLINLFITSRLRRTMLLLAHRKVTAIRVYERQRTYAGLRVHHESLGQFNTDLLWFQQLPDTSLIFQVRAGRIPEAISLAPIPRCEALGHGHLGRVGKSPILPYAPV